MQAPSPKKSPAAAAALMLLCLLLLSSAVASAATSAATSAAISAAISAATSAAISAATPAELLAGYSSQAGSPPVAARGQQFFNSGHGRDWQCASCHGAVPTQTGKHASTGKPIAALAPAFNSERFTDPARVEKWFRRNCNDVVGRACSAAEKADLLAWLLTLKP